jgi:D-serine deaminase-like pyridoxal phosphate-dependent protein
MQTPTGLSEITTPALVLDADVMDRNISRAADRALALGIPMRPHIKTPKCLQVADRLLERAARGLTVSTLREAAALVSHGVTDLFYAVELAPQKASFVAALQRRGADIKCLVDSIDAAREIERQAPAGVRIPFLVALDTDGYRGGLAPDDPELLSLAKYLDRSPKMAFVGLMAYAGASYHLEGAPAKGALAETQCAAAFDVKSRLARAGIETPIVSIGSTPAWMNASRLDGASELRGGIYVFQDLFQAGAGHCRVEDIALTVLATVISVQPRRNRFLIDAGGLALSKDRSTAGRPFDAGYGLLASLQGGTPIDDLYVQSVHQEHGVVTSRSGAPVDLSAYKPGTLLRVLPNHSDMTAAAYEEYYVVRSGTTVCDRWSRFNGWAPADVP